MVNNNFKNASDPTNMNLSDDSVTTQRNSRGQQGFASMDKSRQREIASKGGKAAHQQGTAHEWTSAEAKAAGRKGGQSRSSSNSEVLDLIEETI